MKRRASSSRRKAKKELKAIELNDFDEFLVQLKQRLE